MVKSERAILRVLFPEVRAKLWQLLFSTPPEQYYVRELTNKQAWRFIPFRTSYASLQQLISSAVGLMVTIGFIEQTGIIRCLEH
jgi:hypothetical protein